MPLLASSSELDSQYRVLSGLRPDLYRSFMARTWRIGIAERRRCVSFTRSLHFTEKKAARIYEPRHIAACVAIGNSSTSCRSSKSTTMVSYGVHVYGVSKESPHFLMAASLYHPDTVERSFGHEGGTEVPGLKDAEGNWDTRPILSASLLSSATLASLGGDLRRAGNIPPARPHGLPGQPGKHERA